MHNHSHSSEDNHAHGGHGHHHAHTTSFDNVNLSFIIAVVANLIFTIVEAGYAWYANSVSLMGDAGHNLSDVLGLLLAWGAAYLATKKASDSYSYGYRRTTIMAALVNSLILVLAAGYIAYESL